MHTEAALAGEPRTELGSLKTRKLRQNGLVPGNICGHGQPPETFSVKAEDIEPIIRSGTKVVDLTVGNKTEKAMVLEVQWNTFGTHVQHIDLLRVDPNERIHVEVPIEIKGIAAGTLSGGVLEHPLHHLEIECLAYMIPNTFIVKVQDLQVGQSLHVRELECPEGMKLLNDPDEIVVHIVKVGSGEVVPAGEGAATQPEVIGKKEKEDAAAADDKKKK